MKALKLPELAKDMGVDPAVLKKTIEQYNSYAQNKNDPFGRKFFKNAPGVDDLFHVGIISPVVHYTMGGLSVSTESEVLDTNGNRIEGL